ncbi:MAG: cobalt ECF transporter T component CbiQ [Rhodospirillaceae bacterium]|nr:cobalt ECF transporter T component CbiQ [Rhodospirillales bacterium]
MIACDRLAHTSRWRTRPLAEKALLSLGLLALAVTLPPAGGALVLGVALTAALAAGTPPLALLRLIAAPMAFILTGALTLLVEIGADGIHLSATGATQAAALVLRALAAVVSLLLLAVTTPASELVQGLRRLGLSAEVAEVALATYRFLFVLQDTAAAIHATQTARLGTTGWRRRIRSTGMLVATLLPRALDRAHRLEVGLAARGFDGSLRTISPTRPAQGRRLALVAVLLVSVGVTGAWL